jgi:hypothetical protein
MVQQSYSYNSVNILRITLLQTWYMKGKVNMKNVQKFGLQIYGNTLIFIIKSFVLNDCLLPTNALNVNFI